jgi:squalene cyclase
VRADDPAILQAADWLRSRQTTEPGDWAKTVDVAPGGWYFEYANEFYPDVDDTAMSLMALQTLFRDEEETRDAGWDQRAGTVGHHVHMVGVVASAGPPSTDCPSSVVGPALGGPALARG